MEERRRHERFKALEGTNAVIQAEDSDLHTQGILLNISKGGGYIFGPSIPFQAAQVTFQLLNGDAIRRRCRRIYPHHTKAQGQAVAFSEELTDAELDALKAPIVE